MLYLDYFAANKFDVIKSCMFLKENLKKSNNKKSLQPYWRFCWRTFWHFVVLSNDFKHGFTSCVETKTAVPEIWENLCVWGCSSKYISLNREGNARLHDSSSFVSTKYGLMKKSKITFD